jgi:hypothetical protein
MKPKPDAIRHLLLGTAIVHAAALPARAQEAVAIDGDDIGASSPVRTGRRPAFG